MFGKCIKHEFRATSRQLVPLLIAMLSVSIFGGIFFGISLRIPTQSTSAILYNLSEVLSGIFMFLLIALMIAVSVVAFVMIIRRFYTSFFTDEGYLTFTLPVATDTHIFSKLVVAYVWQVVTTVGSLFSLFIMVLFMLLIGGVEESAGDATVEIGDMLYFLFGGSFNAINPAVLTISAILAVVWILLSIAASILMLYLAIAFACMLAKKHRVILGIVSYYIISMVFSIGNSIAQVIMAFLMNTDVGAGILFYLVISNVLVVIQILICFLGTRWILSKKLNLD